MDDKNKALLDAVGTDIPLAMERFMNNEALYIKFLFKLQENTQFDELESYLEEKNWGEALMTSHNLKSLTGNLSLITLHKLLSDQVALLRADKRDEAVALMTTIREEFDRILGLLDNY